VEELLNSYQELKGCIDETVVLFYQQNINDGFKKMDILLLHIEKVTDLLYQKENIKENINTILDRVMLAMQEMDTIVLADTLKYELVSYYEKMLELN